MFTYFVLFVALFSVTQCNIVPLNTTDGTKLSLASFATTNVRVSAGTERRFPDGYIPSPALGVAYKIHKQTLEWNKARKVCYDEGAQLAILNSITEKIVLFEMMRTVGVESVWIGVHNFYDPDDWTTVTGVPLAATGFSGWRAGEPNNAGGEEHCVELALKDAGGGLNDVNCTVEAAFLCKIYM